MKEYRETVTIATTTLPRPLVADSLGVSADTLPEGDLPLGRFAERYLDYLRATYETEAFDAHPDYWTDLLMAALVDDHPETALDAICAALALCDDVEEVEIIAAGPLEDLMDAHGADLLFRLDEIASNAPRFRLALALLWQEAPGKPLLVARVKGLAGGADPEGDLPPSDGL
ncbi:DUF6869 domain-containing protein [Maritimibacter sp. UBA3975]|uniref:DUF6869 domain-containing protein n=1 Tax=Maritimibacter sp. UBA3975 TaxID=1946833 RepID=UPI0025BE06CF|nr:hypothetical protein [Maritimibacter sp. UBA3975]